MRLLGDVALVSMSLLDAANLCSIPASRLKGGLVIPFTNSSLQGIVLQLMEKLVGNALKACMSNS